jgi:NAD(P)-dependent dehydrogenase (short-subunit alcohol dehydrogenase family)
LKAAAKRWETAFVTGGGSGIGLRLTEMLLDRGARVAIFDLRIADAVRAALQARSTAHGGSACSFHEVDIRDRVRLGTAVVEAVACAGAPGLAINCAGTQVSKAFEELSGEEFDFVVGVNLVGSRNFAAAVLPYLRAGGQLAFIASLAGIVSNYGYAAYNASKFGVVGFAGALRLEYKPKGIAVSVVCPPEVETPMVAAERASGHPISLQLKEFSGTLSVQDACQQILRGLEAQRWMIVPGRRARFTRRLAMIVPGLMNAISDRMVRQAMRRIRATRPDRVESDSSRTV